jgi:hypothetical protein
MVPPLHDTLFSHRERLEQYPYRRKRRRDLHQVVRRIDVELGQETVQPIDPALVVRVVGRHVRRADDVVEALARPPHGRNDVIPRPELGNL